MVLERQGQQGQQGQQGSQGTGGGGQSGGQQGSQQQAQEGQQQQQQQQQQQSQQATQVDPKLKEAGFESVDQVLQTLSAVVQDARQSKAVARNLMAEKTGGQRTDEEPEPTEDDFIHNPKDATVRTITKLQKQHAARMEPLANQLIEGNVQMQMMQLQQDPLWGPLLPDLKGDLDEFLKHVPGEVKAQPGAVLTALQSVAGRNFPKIAKKYNEIIARQGAGSQGGSNASQAAGSGGNGAATEELAPEEEASMQKQIRAGIFKDKKDYLEWKNKEI